MEQEYSSRVQIFWNKFCRMGCNRHELSDNKETRKGTVRLTAVC